MSNKVVVLEGAVSNFNTTDQCVLVFPVVLCFTLNCLKEIKEIVVRGYVESGIPFTILKVEWYKGRLGVHEEK